MTRRLWTPCRECGRDHKNPRSSSLCPTCGIEASRRRIAIEAELAARAPVDPVEAAMNAAYGFDDEQRAALEDMFRAFYNVLRAER